MTFSAFVVTSGFVIFLTIFQNAATQRSPTQPEQIHLSLGMDSDQMVVTWVTMAPTGVSIVEFGPNSFTNTTKGTEEQFVDGGSEHRTMYMHRVTLSGLHPNTRYVYRVGDPGSWSAQYFFVTMPAGSNWTPRFAMYGDMGDTNARSMIRLQSGAQNRHFDMVLHVGDFAYDMHSKNARVGDEFMRQITKIAAYVPYMTCPGNHERAYNFSNYKARFTMPGGDGKGQYYSFNVGPVHFIFFSTEFYYYTYYGWNQIVNQYKWLVQDLAEANKPENRAKRPWIIAMGHRPMYCSNLEHENNHCFNFNNMVRVGIRMPGSKTVQYGLEDLFYRQGVDMIAAGHEHSYERMWPVYGWKVCNGSSGPYINPPAPVHIVTGSAGCREGQHPFGRPQPWSAFRSNKYGYTRFQVLNRTHIFMEQVSDPLGNVVDSIWIAKSQHGPGLYTCHLKPVEDFRGFP